MRARASSLLETLKLVLQDAELSLACKSKRSDGNLQAVLKYLLAWQSLLAKILIWFKVLSYWI